MAICMITLDHSSSGTYFWNYNVEASSTASVNGTEISSEVKAQTISQTQLLCRLVIYVGLSTLLYYHHSLKFIGVKSKVDSIGSMTHRP